MGIMRGYEIAWQVVFFPLFFSDSYSFDLFLVSSSQDSDLDEINV